MNPASAPGSGARGTCVEDWDRVMAVNLRSPFLGCKHGLEALGATAEHRPGWLNSIARSDAPAAYAASKAALEALCRQAAVEGAPKVRVNLLLPGLIDTSLGRIASRSVLRATGSGSRRAPGDRLGGRLRRAFPAPGESSYVTGQTLVVTAG